MACVCGSGSGAVKASPRRAGAVRRGIYASRSSKYPVVVIPLAMQHYQLLERNLLYTAVARGRKLVVIIAEAKALRMAVRRRESLRRVTRLRERLREGLGA